MATPPVAFVCDGAAASSSGVPRAMQGKIVLLVEDDDTVAGLVMHILKRAQHEVLRARGRSDCLVLWQTRMEEIALVILDCRLADGEGASLCHELRALAPDVPVLLTSGRDHSRDPLVTEGIATAFLRKPFRPAEVEGTVAALLGAIA